MAKRVSKTENTDKVKVSVSIPKREKELLDLMLKRAGLSFSEMIQSYGAAWIYRNSDLLNVSEKKDFDDFLNPLA